MKEKKKKKKSLVKFQCVSYWIYRISHFARFPSAFSTFHKIFTLEMRQTDSKQWAIAFVIPYFRLVFDTLAHNFHDLACSFLDKYKISPSEWHSSHMLLFLVLFYHMNKNIMSSGQIFCYLHPSLIMCSSMFSFYSIAWDIRDASWIIPSIDWIKSNVFFCSLIQKKFHLDVGWLSQFPNWQKKIYREAHELISI